MKSNLITASRERCLRACPRKHQYAYEIGLRPTVAAPPLRFGTAIHGAIECMENGGDPVEWLNQNCDLDPYVFVKARAMMTAYQSRWSGEPWWTREDARTEKALYATIPGWESYDQGGKVDGIVRLNDGRLALVETKTTSSAITDPRYWDALALDAQVSTYYVLARANGINVETCIYNVLVKPKHEPLLATPAENRKYRKDGQLYANQRDTDETPDEYESRLLGELCEFPERYFARREIPRLLCDLERFMVERGQTVDLIEHYRRLGPSPWPRNDKACFDYGRRCDYWGLCTGQVEMVNNGPPPGFEIVDEVHPELEESDDDEYANGQTAATE